MPCHLEQSSPAPAGLRSRNIPIRGTDREKRRFPANLYLRNLREGNPLSNDDPKMATSASTRRWERMPVDMPVRVITSKGFSTTVVEGRGTEMSQGGMVLYAGILLNPGDLLEIEFDTPMPSRIPAIVRSKNGFCFGLEFITPLPQ